MRPASPCAPPLVLILVQAFISEANANWAAAAYVAGTPLAVHELRRWSARWPLWSSFAVNSFVMVVLWIALVAPPFADMIGAGVKVRDQDAGVVAAAPADDFATRERIDSAEAGVIRRDAVNPAGL